MPDRSFLQWPFFEGWHRELAERCRAWAQEKIRPTHEGDVFSTCKHLVRQLAQNGWLRYAVPSRYGGAREVLDVRALCLIREHLAYQSGLADFAFAMQGLGSGPISLFGSEQLKQSFLPRFANGELVGAFAISEPGAGSDLRAMQASAKRDGDAYILDGTKTWISNAGLAGMYVVFCRFPEMGEKAFLALAVPADSDGIIIENFEVLAPHPIGTVRFHHCRVPRSALIGEEGQGLKIALSCLDVFRATVGGAALGFARRALDEAIGYAQQRQMFGKALSEFQLTQAKLADMAVAVDSAALLVYRAAWTHDVLHQPVTRESAMAKLQATELAQQVIDAALQMLGARGLLAGSVTEQLYREIRALRIYEGASEVQKLVIASQLLKSSAGAARAE